MRHIGLALIALVLGQVLVAQPTVQQAKAEWQQCFQQRKPAPSPLRAQRVRTTAAKQALPSAKGHTLPDEARWVPGEWEEVQAVVLTPLYSYKPLNVSAPDYWSAEPLLAGWADLYEYARQSPTDRQYSWQYRGVGRYQATLDTVDARSQVLFFLIDAIQQGGAEAWVHVEQYADSALILQHLATMGLRHDHIRFFASPSNSFWYRDCGPICFYYGEADSLGMLDFEYYSGRALDDSLPSFLSRQFNIPCFSTTLEWEGGNCLTDGAGMAVSSDRLYSANADDEGQYTWDGTDIASLAVATKTPLSAPLVRDSLSRLLALRELTVLPSLQFDGGTGHIDLYADMTDENSFVFSKMPSHYSRWADYGISRRNIDTLASRRSWAQLPFLTSSIPFPSRDNGAYFASQTQYESFTRTYSNHLFVNQLLVQPCFSTVGDDGWPTAAWDRNNVQRVAAAYPGYRLYCIDVRAFDGSGGSLHCLTKQIPAFSPIRILHSPVVGNLTLSPAADSIPIEALITNNRGIAQAVLHYRANGGTWQQAPLRNTEAHRFAGAIPLAALANSQPLTIDYYIAATNADAKTITKPMTALQGGYYTFSVGGTGGLTTATDTAMGTSLFYPNPASNEVHFDLHTATSGTTLVDFLDAAGRTVFSTSLPHSAGSNTFVIPLRHLPAGTYTARIANGETVVVRKLIVY